jgi:glyoxylase-like metal-dependent hydrolase (beta-lactamase superfamily II)
MRKTKIAPALVIYEFPPREDKHYGFQLTVLLNDESGQAMLIDTGYEEHAAAVRTDLERAGYEIRAVVISHFHPDHILGLQALGPIEILGSPRYEETLAEFGPRSEWKSLTPTQLTKECETIAFGGFQLAFLPAPGHASCSQYTLIDEAFVHVADNVMTSNDGRDILPWAEFADIPQHIASLEALYALKERTFLLSHGRMMTDEQVRETAIDNRIRYFHNVWKAEGALTYEEATRGCTCDFLHPEWLIRKGN